MQLQEIAKAIGIQNTDEIAESVYAYYPITKTPKYPLCSLEMIDRLQTRFNLFEHFYEDVRNAWLQLEQNEYQRIWVDLISTYMFDHTDYLRHLDIPVPDSDGTPAGDFLLLFCLLPSVEPSYEEYCRRGFSEKELKDLMHQYSLNMVYSQNTVDRPALIAGYYHWLWLYAKSVIFRCGSLNFEQHTQDRTYVLKNKENGQLLPLSIPQTMHREGMPLGTAGYEDAEGSYAVTFEETEDAYIGFPAVDLVFPNQKTVYLKSEWELILRPGELCIGVHIPRKTLFTPEAVTDSIEGAKKIIAERFPEWTSRVITCTSWLLCPDFEYLLKPGSNIAAFGRRFIRFPVMNNGRGPFSCVFPQNFKGTYDQLPEDTSLMRVCKKRYMEGGCILNYSGVIAL